MPRKKSAACVFNTAPDALLTSRGSVYQNSKHHQPLTTMSHPAAAKLHDAAEGDPCSRHQNPASFILPGRVWGLSRSLQQLCLFVSEWLTGDKEKYLFRDCSYFQTPGEDELQRRALGHMLGHSSSLQMRQEESCRRKDTTHKHSFRTCFAVTKIDS